MSPRISSTSSNLTSGDIMVRFESVTESEAFKRYNKDNPNAQIPPRKTASFYELQDYIIAINDDGEVVGTAGWKDYGDYAVVGGMHSRAAPGTPSPAPA